MTSTEKDYAGICACCFAPVRVGKEKRFREPGRTFHAACVEKHPNDYYVKLERQLAARAAKKRQVT